MIAELLAATGETGTPLEGLAESAKKVKGSNIEADCGNRWAEDDLVQNTTVIVLLIIVIKAHYVVHHRKDGEFRKMNRECHQCCDNFGITLQKSIRPVIEACDQGV